VWGGRLALVVGIRAATTIISASTSSSSSSSSFFTVHPYTLTRLDKAALHDGGQCVVVGLRPRIIILRHGHPKFRRVDITPLGCAHAPLVHTKL